MVIGGPLQLVQRRRRRYKGQVTAIVQKSQPAEHRTLKTTCSVVCHVLRKVSFIIGYNRNVLLAPKLNSRYRERSRREQVNQIWLESRQVPGYFRRWQSYTHSGILAHTKGGQPNNFAWSNFTRRVVWRKDKHFASGLLKVAERVVNVLRNTIESGKERFGKEGDTFYRG